MGLAGAPPLTSTETPDEILIRGQTSEVPCVEINFGGNPVNTGLGGSACRNRTKLSRKSAWSSSNSNKIAIFFSIASGIDAFLGRAQHWHRYSEATPRRSGLVGQFTAETPHDRARHIKPQPTNVSTALKRSEQIFRGGDPDASIFEADNDPAIFLRRLHAQSLRLCRQHRMLAILCEIQEDLNESISIGPNEGQWFSDLPYGLDSRFTAGILN